MTNTTKRKPIFHIFTFIEKMPSISRLNRQFQIHQQISTVRNDMLHAQYSTAEIQKISFLARHSKIDYPN